MKKELLTITTTLFCAAMFLYSCTKNEQKVPYTIVEQQAKLKIKYDSPYKANPTVQIKLNDQRVTSGITSNYPFPGGGLNTNGGSQPDYLLVSPGTIKLSISIPNAGSNTDSVVLYATTLNVPDNKYYTAHVTDTAANTQVILVNNDVASPDSGYSKYKFVNLMPNVPAVDLYFGGVVVAPNIAYKGSSSPFNIVFPTASSWEVRPAGAPSNSTALATYKNTSPNQRVFTVFARGYAGATDATRKPAVALEYDR
jgi:hypothetical protein